MQPETHIYIIHKNKVSTSQKTQSASIIKSRYLQLYSSYDCLLRETTKNVHKVLIFFSFKRVEHKIATDV